MRKIGKIIIKSSQLALMGAGATATLADNYPLLQLSGVAIMVMVAIVLTNKHQNDE